MVSHISKDDSTGLLPIVQKVTPWRLTESYTETMQCNRWILARDLLKHIVVFHSVIAELMGAFVGFN